MRNMTLKIEGKADQTAQNYNFFAQYSDQTKLVFIRGQKSQVAPDEDQFCLVDILGT